MTTKLGNEEKRLAGRITSELRSLGDGYRLQIIYGQRNHGWVVVDDQGKWIIADQDLNKIAEKVDQMKKAK